MRLLLDTHTFLWFIDEREKLRRDTERAIEDSASEVFVSAASAWEITTKYRIGKLPLAATVAGDVGKVIAERGFDPLPVTVEHGQLAGALSGDHKDPFDRMLAAQAIVEGLSIVSNDRAFDAFGVKRLW